MLILQFHKFQVTIHEDSMSIADSIFSMRVANALPPNSGMNGRHSRQSSLSIQSASGIRASPTIGLSVHVFFIFLVHEELSPRSGSRQAVIYQSFGIYQTVVRLSLGSRQLSGSCQAVIGSHQAVFGQSSGIRQAFVR